MKIICPDCGFSRDVAPEDLPPRTVIANCPKCACRFRFSPTEGVLGKVQDRNPGAPEISDVPPRPREDDPLPEGAIIVDPKRASEEEEDEERPRQKKRSSRAKATVRGLTALVGTGNPWSEAPGQLGWFLSFYQTLLHVLFAAPRFFRSIREEPIARPLMFFICVTVIEFFCNFIWMTVFRALIADSTDPQVVNLLALISPKGNIFLVLLLQTALATLKLAVLSAIFYSVYRAISGGSPSYNCIFQVVAYAVAPSVLAIVPIVGALVGSLWGLACLAIGLRQVLSLTWMQTAVGFLPLIVLYAIFLHYVVLL